jgi:hypothetical protein
VASSGGRPRGAGVAIALASMRSKGGNVVEDDNVEQLGIVDGNHYVGTQQFTTQPMPN